jgi:Big-like domain-containing protein
VRVWRFDQPFPAAEPGTPPQGLLVYRTTDWSADIGHLSHANAQPGVALDQQYVCGGNASRNRLPRNNEVLCFRLDGSLQVLVVAPVMTNLDATGGGNDYAKLPKGNLDVTGQYFIWTSNAGGSRLDAFLVKVPVQLLGVSSGGGGGDTTAPTVYITAPGAGSAVSGSVTVSASASDNVGVAGVQFKLDGANLGPELTPAPFSMSWNTTGTANGAHTLTATARDSAGNTKTSAGVSITVANTTGGGGTFSDNFNRPDSTVLGNGWQEVQGDLLVAYSELRSTTAKGNKVGVIGLTGATQTVGADFASADNNTSPRLGVVLRYQDPQNYYLIYRRVGGSSVLRISRIVNGAETILASASIPNPVRNTFFHLTGRATGTTLALELDGVSKLSVSDSRWSSGRVGISLGSSGRASHRADNFSASAQ